MDSWGATALENRFWNQSRDRFCQFVSGREPNGRGFCKLMFVSPVPEKGRSQAIRTRLDLTRALNRRRAGSRLPRAFPRGNQDGIATKSASRELMDGLMRTQAPEP